MESTFIQLIGMGILIFAGTNIDDFFVLLSFFGDQSFKVGEIVLGQYIGILLLILISVICSFLKFIIPADWIGLLGIFPILIGLKHLLSLRLNKNNNMDSLIIKSKRSSHGFNHSMIFSVSVVTFSNGGDNISIYVPLFALSKTNQIIVFIAVFLFFTLAWCSITYYIVNHTFAGNKIKQYGQVILPFALFALGGWILSKSILF